MEEEGHFPHRRYHCTWERDGGTAKGERKQSRKLKSSDEMWEREEDEGRELLLPKEQPTYS